MLDFSKINKKNWKYEILYRYLQLVHNFVYYRQYRVKGKENFPKNEGFLIIGNHQNSLNDALGILFIDPKSHPIYIARADIFKKPLLGKLMRFIRIMPAFRQRDGKEELDKNNIVFNEAMRIMSEGDCVAIFPEATHMDGRYLGQFKKGFARIAFGAAEQSDFKINLKIVPVTNNYSDYFRFQTKLLITVGKPFEFSELYDLYKENPEKARYQLTQKARAAVEELMVNLDDVPNYPQLETICTAYRDKYITDHKLKLRQIESEAQADIAAANVLRSFRENNPEQYNTLIDKAREYGSLLKELKLRDWIFGHKPSFFGFLLKAVVWLALLPLWIVCAVLNFVPYYAGFLVTNKVKDKMMGPSIHFGLGMLVTMPLWNLIVAVTAGIVSHSWLVAIASLVLLPFTMILYSRSKGSFKKLINRIRRSNFVAKKDRRYMRATELRNQIIAVMDALLN